MRTVYVVTHPEATHHVDGVVGGWYDSELTPYGLRAADAIAHAVHALIPTNAPVELFTSDLRRTVQTAEPLAARLGLTPILDPRLRERSYGEAGGRPRDWLDRRQVPPPPVGNRLWHDEGIPGAETRGAHAERVYRALEVITDREREHTVIVTHGGSLTFVIAAWIRMPLESAGHVGFHSTSGGITVLQEDDRNRDRRVLTLADSRHLPEADRNAEVSRSGRR
ncbi:histidine phosphatase family protein [Nocardia bovistercoris]|uniref:Histidine phosphatase family protein n=1 Tax=Nocardia bovistercoris TaxID=2785916 RepID=A0A931N558_9NOCA|nr:histidine phosphatase family protein [Nocardia bovistercoris]MBH0779509.1 histidine phosphatase family protein [Nocardia bovistercoris]